MFGIFYLLPHSHIFQFSHIYRLCSSSWFICWGFSIGTEMLAVFLLMISKMSDLCFECMSVLMWDLCSVWTNQWQNSNPGIINSERHFREISDWGVQQYCRNVPKYLGLGNPFSASELKWAWVFPARAPSASTHVLIQQHHLSLYLDHSNFWETLVLFLSDPTCL